MSAAFLASEVVRCMESMISTGEFPEDTCPADLLAYALELQQMESL